MPIYFFDTTENGQHIEDDLGILCSSVHDARVEAMKALPAIAKDKIPKNGDRQSYTVMVRDVDGRMVYSAILTFAGLCVADGTE